ncbi:MAG: hypothetical protein HF982_05970 [Desulfobacteraceae bacterium]|nr:hypothetical protein [Desulfobacteraceae bacterium]MBC2719123.1 hypothetical protein [Desulfobacteraceae bacterium]
MADYAFLPAQRPEQFDVMGFEFRPFSGFQTIPTFETMLAVLFILFFLFG